MSRNEDFTTGNLIDYLYHQKYYKLIGIGLSRQTNMSIRQQINFTENLEEDDCATMFLLLRSSNNSSYIISLIVYFTQLQFIYLIKSWSNRFMKS